MSEHIRKKINGITQSKVPADPDAYDRAEGVLSLIKPIVELALTALTASGSTGQSLADDLRRRVQDGVEKPGERMINSLDTAAEVLGVLAQVGRMQEGHTGETEFSYGSMLSGGRVWSRFQNEDVRAMRGGLAPTLSLVEPALEQARTVLNASSQGRQNLELVSLQDAAVYRQSRAVGDVFDAFHGSEGGADTGGNIQINIAGKVVYSAHHFPNAERCPSAPPPAPSR